MAKNPKKVIAGKLSVLGNQHALAKQNNNATAAKTAKDKIEALEDVLSSLEEEETTKKKTTKKKSKKSD